MAAISPSSLICRSASTCPVNPDQRHARGAAWPAPRESASVAVVGLDPNPLEPHRLERHARPRRSFPRRQPNQRLQARAFLLELRREPAVGDDQIASRTDQQHRRIAAEPSQVADVRGALTSSASISAAFHPDLSLSRRE